MELFLNKKDCFGCGVCEAACSQGAISMQADPEGFAYPVVKDALCIGCGRCKEVCPIGHMEGVLPEHGMAFLSQRDDCRGSSSGGAFSAVVHCFWGEHPGAPVYGACLTSEMNVEHCCVRMPEELTKLQGSKYVQSDMKEVYPQILEQLERGEYVLFSGTPCQVAGLARLTGEYREHLLLVDLVCNGVGSPRAWKRYLELEAEQNGSAIVEFNFRNKRYFLGRGISSALSDGRVIQKSHPEDLFSVCYQRNLISRESCYHCPYTAMARVSDLTLGDFHGLEKVDPEFSNCGASLVLAHTPKGRSYSKAITEQGKYKTYPLESCRQPRLEYPTKKPPLRMLLLRDLCFLPTKTFLQKYQKILFGGVSSD